jgi:hypothetical protein
MVHEVCVDMGKHEMGGLSPLRRRFALVGGWNTVNTVLVTRTAHRR